MNWYIIIIIRNESRVIIIINRRRRRRKICHKKLRLIIKWNELKFNVAIRIIWGIIKLNGKKTNLILN